MGSVPRAGIRDHVFDCMGKQILNVSSHLTDPDVATPRLEADPGVSWLRRLP